MARFSELARGVISGDRDGMLKLLVSPEDRSVLGVHVLGTSATDLVHIGQAVMAAGAGGLDFLVTAVFNYPTFAESYKVAALDADNRIKAMKAFGDMKKGGPVAALIRGEREVEGQAAAGWGLGGAAAWRSARTSHWLMIAASARSRSVRRVAAISGRFRRSTGEATAAAAARGRSHA